MSKAAESSAQRGSELPWIMSTFKTWKSRLKLTAAITGLPFGFVTAVWCELQESAQRLNDGGRFEIERGELAIDNAVSLEKVDSVLAAFTHAEVGVIVDGRLKTFWEREPSRDQRHRQNKKEKGAAAVVIREGKAEPSAKRTAEPRRGRDAESPSRDADALSEGASATRNRAESSESSPLRVTEKIEIPASSSSDSTPAREPSTTTTEDEIFEVISKIDPANISERVARAFVPTALKLIGEGVRFVDDIVPAIQDVAAHTRSPRVTLTDVKTRDKIRQFCRKRLSGASPPSGREHIDFEQEFLRELQAAGNA